MNIDIAEYLEEEVKPLIESAPILPKEGIPSMHV